LASASIGQREATCFNHKQDQIHIADHTHDGAIERFVQGCTMVRLKARGIDKNILACTACAYASNAMPRSLCLARGDADFLSNQGVEQRGLANIGLANNGNQTAALLDRR